ncbi:MAG TPA: hypothetical protein VKP65_15975 [Rhodothermales bacterium]|nr:hypothetical protein [Rhodothermales bacterium]
MIPLNNHRCCYAGWLVLPGALLAVLRFCHPRSAHRVTVRRGARIGLIFLLGLLVSPSFSLAQPLADFTGRWDTSFGEMDFVVRDGGIYASYPSDDGRIFLQQEGKQLVGFWIERFSSQHCGEQKDGSPYWGRLAFAFNDDVTAFEGQWSYCLNEVDGNWDGTRIGPPTAPPSQSGGFIVADVYIEAPPCAEGQIQGSESSPCVWPVYFHSAPNLILNQAKAISSQNSWHLATAAEVQAAWQHLGLDHFSFGMLADGSFALPLQQDRPPFKRGANLGINGVNQGFYYVPAVGSRAPADPSKVLCYIEATRTLETCTNIQTSTSVSDPAPSYGDAVPNENTPPRALGALPGEEGYGDSLLGGSGWRTVGKPSLARFWNGSDQHPAQLLFGLGDAVLMRSAARLQLSSKSQPSTPAAVDELLGTLIIDAGARYQFAPFLLQAAFEALSTPNPNAGQAAFRGAFEQYMSYAKYEITGMTYDEWRLFNGAGEFKPKDLNYTTTAANFLPVIPDVAGFQATLDNPMYIGPKGRETIELLLAPLVAASLPEFKNTPLGQLGTNLDAIAAGIGIAGSVGTAAGTLGVLSAGVFGFSVQIGVNTAAGWQVANAAYLVSNNLLVASSSSATLSSSALIGVGISLALAAMIGKSFADLAKSDALDRELRRTLDAGLQPVDAHALTRQGQTEANRSSVFSYLLRMLIADPADNGYLTLSMPEVTCPPGLKTAPGGCYREVKFHSQAGMSLQQAQELAARNQWVLATESDVLNAWTHLKLDVYAFGMMASGRFAVPVQSNHSNFRVGHNIGASGGNQGFFYTMKPR